MPDTDSGFGKRVRNGTMRVWTWLVGVVYGIGRFLQQICLCSMLYMTKCLLYILSRSTSIYDICRAHALYS